MSSGHADPGDRSPRIPRAVTTEWMQQ